jgi:protein-S-isoprenylcysteine O-methyltransferase Ste14
MPDLIGGLKQLPGYGIAAVILIVLYGIQAELRFGQRARTRRADATDRKSTRAVSVCAAVPLIGFVMAMKANSSLGTILPGWFRGAVLPGGPMVEWVGIAFGACGLALRLWAVLTLRQRYTRTLLIQQEHSIERGGPYRWVRHPGYLGSLLVLNGIALASGNWIVLFAALIATLSAYAYRIRVEDEMLVGALGDAYAQYRREVRALVPSLRRHWPSHEQRPN